VVVYQQEAGTVYSATTNISIVSIFSTRSDTSFTLTRKLVLMTVLYNNYTVLE